MAASYVEAILKERPSGPYHLGGLSFGGLVAFEAAHQLKARGAEVGLLALFDTPGPNAFRPKPKLARIFGHVQNTLRFGMPYLHLKLGKRFGIARGALSGREQSSTKTVVAPLDPAAQRRAFSRYAASYEIKPYPGRILFFGLSERNGMSDALFDPALDYFDPMLGWGSVADGGVDAFYVDGDHTGMLAEPHVRRVATLMTQFLASRH